MHDFNLLTTGLTILIVFGAVMGTVAYLILLERWIAAWVQDRIGPNRVGPFGLFQPLADGLKFLLKEEVIPGHVDKPLFLLAPMVAMGTALLGIIVVPFGPVTPPPTPPVAPPALTAAASPERKVEHAEAVKAYETKLADYRTRAEEYRSSYQFVIAPGVDIGILFVFAISSLAVYGVILGGYSANNKYAFLGSLRSSAQIISYEIPLGLSILGIVLMTGSLNLERIIWHQVQPADGSLGMWNVFYQPLAFLIFLISVFAETNRLPFDLPEAEQELVGGFHTEYSGMKFAMFFLGEYAHMIVASFLMTILFFGGWHFPFVATAESFWLIKLLVMALKMGMFIVFYMLVRWTIPRFRFDQLMGLAWKVLIPLALINLVLTMIVKEMNWTPWLLLPATLGVLIGAAAWTGGSPAPQRREEIAVGSQ